MSGLGKISSGAFRICRLILTSFALRNNRSDCVTFRQMPHPNGGLYSIPGQARILSSLVRLNKGIALVPKGGIPNSGDGREQALSSPTLSRGRISNIAPPILVAVAPFHSARRCRQNDRAWSTDPPPPPMALASTAMASICSSPSRRPHSLIQVLPSSLGAWGYRMHAKVSNSGDINSNSDGSCCTDANRGPNTFTCVLTTAVAHTFLSEITFGIRIQGGVNFSFWRLVKTKKHFYRISIQPPR